MTPFDLLDDLSARGVIVSVAGDAIELDAPADSLTDADVMFLRDHKPETIRLLRLAEGLAVDDDAERLLSMELIDPAEVPVCSSCGRSCDEQTLVDTWHCSACDPEAEIRKQRTKRLLLLAAKKRYTNKCNG